MSARSFLRGVLVTRAPRFFLLACKHASSAELGLAGEELVARALRARGASIEGRRIRTPWGELDLLAHDARGLVCVEVKTARCAPRPRIRGMPPVPLAARDLPGARVDARGRERLARIARGVSARRGIPARAEVWEVLVGPGRTALAVRPAGPR